MALRSLVGASRAGSLFTSFSARRRIEDKKLKITTKYQFNIRICLDDFTKI